MTHQKSEDRTVPEGRRKPSPTQHDLSAGGGIAVPVEKVESQQLLLFATAESPRTKRGAESGQDVDSSTRRTNKARKAKSKSLPAVPATLEEVVERLNEAFGKVAANRGAPGPDRQTINLVRQHWGSVQAELADSLLEERYKPGDIRRVWIAKPGGGERGLGIPNVIDRVVQEAVRAALEPHYEPTFHASSHGFRPKRSCHTAIAEASSYIEEGYTWLVDIDLEKFFDQVNRQRLLSRLATRVSDKRLLAIIGKMLKAKVVLPNGTCVTTAEGLPQGGPLSPLLSNVVLSELDEELARRGLRFVRYADDCNIYVRSERAGRRVMESIKQFINRRLRLSVNAKKSAVARPETRHFLGFRLLPKDGERPEILLSERSEKRLREKVRELTPRARGDSLRTIIKRLNQYLLGWDGFFCICTSGVQRVLQSTDAHIRRRLRAIILKHWKRRRTIARRIIRLGVRERTAWRRVYEGRKSLWTLSHDPAVDRALRNAYFADRGLISLKGRALERWAPSVAPGQLTLPGMS